MSISEFRELTIDELELKILELKKDLMDSRFLLATSQLEDTSVFRKIKKQIAQASTILSQKKQNIENHLKVEEGEWREEEQKFLLVILVSKLWKHHT